MFFDYSSLLLATNIAALAAGLTFFVSWLTGRNGGFLATCSVGMLTVVFSVSIFMYYTATQNQIAGLMACITLLIAMSLGLTGATQFRTGKLHVKRLGVTSACMAALVTLPYFWGFDGLSFIIANAAAALLVFVIAYEYWQCRRESPTAITGLCILYIFVGISYAACSVALLYISPLVLTGPPNNWAETFNLVASVLGVTGIGALSVALNHQRLVKRHLDDSQTDMLTGMLNRRAMFDRFDETGLSGEHALAIFDLDHFKTINDKFGHAAGDHVLRTFANLCRKYLSEGHVCIRLGGEEFVVVMPKTTSSTAKAITESIRHRFARHRFNLGNETFSATVSIGLFINTAHHQIDLDTALREADTALYQAKNNGRDQVITHTARTAA